VTENTAMTFEEIEKDVTTEIDAAEEYSRKRSPRRETSWDRYYGRKLGNEVKGRSQFITREVMDTIEWMMPYFIRTFASGSPKVDLTIEGQDAWIGKALMDKIQIDLSDSSPNIFVLFYQWFKDALVSDTAFVKTSWRLDQEEVNMKFDKLPAQFMQTLSEDPDVTITNPGQLSIDEMTGIAFEGVAAKVKKTLKDGLYAENTPHWEFLADPKSRDVNDEYGKGHKTEVTVDYLKRVNRAWSKDGEKFFRNLEELEDGKSGSDIDESEEINYMGKDANEDGKTEIGPKSPVKFIEWYTRLDVDGDGYLEDIVCYLGNDFLLGWQENDDEFIPFSALKPIIDNYKFYGISYADLLIEIQNLKTMLFRRILDNFDFQNSGRWLKDPGSAIDSAQLLNNSPGSVITGKKDGLVDLTPAPFNPGVLTILEYVDTIKENRTGVTAYNQGMDSGSLNQTATGIVRIQSAAMQRMELIGRIFAEVGLKDFYSKCVLLYQKYLKKSFIARVHGTEKEVSRDMIQGRVKCRVNMGVTASVGAEEAQKLVQIMAMLFKLHEMFPGLLTPEKVHNLARRYITSYGFQEADDFIASLDEYMEQSKAITDQHGKQAQLQEQMMLMQQKLSEMEVMIKKKGVEIKEKKVTQDGILGKMEIEQEREESIRETQQREDDSVRDHKIGLMEILLDRNRPGGQEGR